MDGVRASKRRRLDGKLSTPSPQKRKSTTAKTAPDSNADEQELDIYDDIDGAHNPAQTSTNKRKAGSTFLTKPSSSTRTPTGVRTQIKSTTKVADTQLSDSDDELAGPRTGSLRREPGRSAREVAVSLSSAKKTFGDEIHEAQRSARKQVNAEKAQNGTPKAKRNARVGSDEKTTPRSTGKKTFEDEIKELQEAARKEVNAQNLDNGASSTPKVKRNGRIESAQPARLTPRKPPKSAALQPADLELIKAVLMGKICRKRPIALSGLQEEYGKVSALITQTVTAGESNSMLLVGARGCGKTTLLDQVLREQSERHPDDFLTVRLNGFIHTDDKIALREIWRQLGREVEIDETESTTQNYADTMTTLLALLSHSADEEQLAAGRVSKSVIFILDEFDLFAHHPRQTLLYNLFDIAQSRKAPIAVIGVTTRVDVVESLEKRVKSRFSHRYVHLGLAKNLDAFQNVCKSGLNVFVDELSPAELEQLLPTDAASDELDGSISIWNAFVDKLFADKRFADHLKRLYYTTKSVQQFFTSQIVPLHTLPAHGSLKGKDFVDHFAQAQAGASLAGPDSRLDLLSSLSSLQLALLICAARLNAIHDSETVTFAVVYEEYKSLASKAKLQASASGALAGGSATRVFSKNVARDAWADVLESGLVMDDGRGSGRVDVALNEIAMSDVDLGAWGKWCKEI